MPVAAPTPPTKPAPLELMPSHSMSSSNSDVNTTPSKQVNTPVNPEIAGAVKKIESMQKALQGGPVVKSKDGAKVNTEEAVPAKTNKIQAFSTDSDADTTQTTTQATMEKTPVSSKPTTLNYSPFVAIVVLVAVFLTGLRLLKNEQKKKTVPASFSQPPIEAEPVPQSVIAAKLPLPKKRKKFEVKI